MAFRYVCLVIAILLSPRAFADSWRWKASTDLHKFKDGLSFEYRVRPYNRGYRAHIDLTIRKRSTVLGRYSSIGIREIFPSPSENLFVVLSNSGLPGTAVAVFNYRGELLLHVEHGVASFDYCQQSISVIRTWHNSGKADVWFDDKESLDGITLLDCRGQRVNLLKTVADALARSANGSAH